MQRLAVLFTILALVPLASCQKSGGEAKLKELTDRVAKLEADAAKVREMEAFLAPHMAGAKAKAAQQAAKEPDPNARFAVNIEGNPYIGPAGAAVTVIEAFDFA